MKSKYVEKLLDMLYPENIRCSICNCELNIDSIYNICPKCYMSLPFISHNKCIRCGMSLPDGHTTVCDNCKSSTYHFVRAIAVFDYLGNIRKCIYRYKYSKQKQLSHSLAKFMVDAYVSLDWKIDAVQPIPLHPNRFKERGYNQATLLAEGFCDALSLPIIDTMIRIKDTPSQTTLNREERLENLTDAFIIKSQESVINKNILLIDDVYTTGATIEHATNVLLAAGAKSVYALTLAHAIRKSDKEPQ